MSRPRTLVLFHDVIRLFTVSYWYPTPSAIVVDDQCRYEVYIELPRKRAFFVHDHTFLEDQAIPWHSLKLRRRPVSSYGGYQSYTVSNSFPKGCNTPPVVSKGYKPKGDYITVDGLKTCQSLF